MGKKSEVAGRKPAYRHGAGARGLKTLSLALLLPVVCLGTSIVRVSLEEAVSQSDWIVSGDVVRNWCDWDSAHRYIWTFTEIAVHEQWKGTMGTTVTVAEPGGVVDGKGLAIVGMVRYTPGELVVVFLYRTPIGFIRTVGLTQGKLSIDSAGMVHASPTGAALMTAQGVQATGTPIVELEGNSVSAARTRIRNIAAHLPPAQKGARK